MTNIVTDITDAELKAMLAMKPVLKDFMLAMSDIARRAPSKDETIRLTAALYLRVGNSLVALAARISRIGVANQ